MILQGNLGNLSCSYSISNCTRTFYLHGQKQTDPTRFPATSEGLIYIQSGVPVRLEDEGHS